MRMQLDDTRYPLPCLKQSIRDSTTSRIYSWWETLEPPLRSAHGLANKSCWPNICKTSGICQGLAVVLEALFWLISAVSLYFAQGSFKTSVCIEVTLFCIRVSRASLGINKCRRSTELTAIYTVQVSPLLYAFLTLASNVHAIVDLISSGNYVSRVLDWWAGGDPSASPSRANPLVLA
ncbi:hypothetical protein AG1IA_01708 [Rhizoctonia solani AG-1 IA]|uniref:Uncharacterized protein n=1 Tax=Thanatephorus cucumeris (strain AG1-IA) TaxID=983506 RepID=L8X5G9_THACA|nr:hypothetical protein AG1IA_01708 [Rhizoctonia solani AG-1 IA]